MEQRKRRLRGRRCRGHDEVERTLLGELSKRDRGSVELGEQSSMEMVYIIFLALRVFAPIAGVGKVLSGLRCVGDLSQQ